MENKIRFLVLILIVLITIFLIIDNKLSAFTKSKSIIKKRKVIIGLITLTILISSFLIINSKLDLYINWKIYLPGIQNRKVVFDNFFQDGEQISIFKYQSKWKMKKIKEINHFNEITLENVKNIREELSNFYNKLGYNQKGEGGQAKYNKYINVNQLLSINNYYLIKRKNESYIILILDMNNRCLYTLIYID